MKILVSGKGGTGKTTIATLLSIIFSKNGYNVLALDTDSVPNMAQSLGIPYEESEKIVPLAKNDALAEERTGARPGMGWGVLFSLTPRVDDLADKYGLRINDRLKLVVVGSIDVSKEGCLCPAIALAKAFLLHVMISRNEVIIVDSEAGAEIFGRGLADHFDMNITVSEPTIKSLLIAKKLIRMAKELNVKNNMLVINKATDEIEAAQLFTKIFKDYKIPYHIVRYDPNIVNLEIKGVGLNNLPENSIAYQDIFSLYNKVLKMLRRS